MKCILTIIALSFLSTVQSQTQVKYEVFAVKFAIYNAYFPDSVFAIKPPVKDSVRPTFMFWLIKGSNGKNILVDAGFQRNSHAFDAGVLDYRRRDTALQLMGL